MLSVPHVGQDPSLAASVSTKSGSERIVEAAEVNAIQSICDMFDPSLLHICRSPQLKYLVKLKDEVTGQVVAACEVVETVQKKPETVGQRMEVKR